MEIELFRFIRGFFSVECTELISSGDVADLFVTSKNSSPVLSRGRVIKNRIRLYILNVAISYCFVWMILEFIARAPGRFSRLFRRPWWSYGNVRTQVLYHNSFENETLRFKRNPLRFFSFNSSAPFISLLSGTIAPFPCRQINNIVRYVRLIIAINSRWKHQSPTCYYSPSIN